MQELSTKIEYLTTKIYFRKFLEGDWPMDKYKYLLTYKLWLKTKKLKILGAYYFETLILNIKQTVEI